MKRPRILLLVPVALAPLGGPALAQAGLEWAHAHETPGPCRR